jgi:hypothetical protein
MASNSAVVVVVVVGGGGGGGGGGSVSITGYYITYLSLLTAACGGGHPALLTLQRDVGGG